MDTRKQYVTEKGVPIHGIVASFTTTPQVYHAAERMRDAGYTNWDVYSPFPIHGIDEAMGIKRTRLPIIVGTAAAIGVTSGYLLQWWANNYGYQIVVQGKPFGSLGGGGWEAFIPVIFELGVLFAAFASLIGMLVLNGLPRHHHPLMAREDFLRVSADTFMICVEAVDPKFDPKGTRALLESLHAKDVDLVEDE